MNGKEGWLTHSGSIDTWAFNVKNTALILNGYGIYINSNE